MSGSARQFVFNDEAAIDEVLVNLGTEHPMRADPPRELSRRWLDTFDWRLYRAGWLLEQVSGDEDALLLTHVGSGRRQSLPWRGDPPRGTGELPAPIRSRLAGVTGERALLPAAEMSAEMRRCRIVDEREKTLARVEVESRRLTSPRGQVLPPLISATPLRGYEPVAEDVSRWLARNEHLQPAGRDPLAEALRRVGVAPGTDPSRFEVHLQPRQPAGDAVRSLLLRLLEIVEVNLDGVVRDLDPEFLHDLRVAVRRSRAAVKLLRNSLPPEDVARFGPELKWLGDLTTPSRDLDVYLMDLLARDGTNSDEGLEAFRTFLVTRRAEAHTALVRGLASTRFKALSHDWRLALTRGEPSTGPQAAAPVARLSHERIRDAYRRMCRLGAKIDDQSDPAALHDLRKRGKEMRYLLEMFGSLHDPDRHRRLVKQLKKLQDVLGEFQDAQVQRAALSEFASAMIREQDGAAEALLAMGRLSRELDDRQRRARLSFADRFEAFVSPANAGRVAKLNAAGPV